MPIDYLSWVKNLDLEAHHQNDISYLATSGISPLLQPFDFLQHNLVENQVFLQDAFKEINPWGHPALVKAISAKYKIPPENILVTGGTSIAEYMICHSLLKKGDRVIVEKPVYEPLLRSPASFEVEIIELWRDFPDYQIDLNRLEQLLEKTKPRLLILSNLHNPTSAFMDNATLSQIASLTQKYGTYVMVDEIFHDFVASLQPPATTFSENIISVNGLSKLYGAGSTIRCGWILASEQILSKVRQSQVLVENIGSATDQILGSLVLKNSEEYIAHWTALLNRNRKLIEDWATRLTEDGLIEGRVPSTGCIYFPRLKNYSTSVEEVVERLFREFKVTVVPGSFFGSERNIRIGFGVDTATLYSGLAALEKGLRSI